MILKPKYINIEYYIHSKYYDMFSSSKEYNIRKLIFKPFFILNFNYD